VLAFVRGTLFNIILYIANSSQNWRFYNPVFNVAVMGRNKTADVWRTLVSFCTICRLAHRATWSTRNYAWSLWEFSGGAGICWMSAGILQHFHRKVNDIKVSGEAIPGILNAGKPFGGPFTNYPNPTLGPGVSRFCPLGHTEGGLA